MDELKKILAKLEKAEAINDEEKAYLKEHVAEVPEESKAKVAEVLAEKDEKAEAIDVEAVKELVSNTIQDVMGGKANEISEKIVKNFMEGVADQRKKAIDGNPVEKDPEKDESTRAFMKALLAGDIAKCKAMTTSATGDSPDDANTGLLIPDELKDEVLRIAETQYGLARREMLYLPFSGPGNTRKIPALGTSVSVYWTDEQGKKKSTQPKFALVTQTLKKLAAMVPFTEEILEDSLINLTQLIAALFAEAVAKEEDLQFFAGDGTPWTGILNNGFVNPVYQETAGVTNLTADDLLSMIDATPSGALAGAKFYMNRTVLSVIRKLKGEDGQYIYQNPGQGLPATIWNYPYELSDAFPLAAEVEEGSPYIAFGNLKMSCIFGDKQQLRVKLLTEATITDTDGETTINLAEQDMVALRIIERVGYVIGLPKAITVLDTAESESPTS